MAKLATPPRLRRSSPRKQVPLPADLLLQAEAQLERKAERTREAYLRWIRVFLDGHGRAPISEADVAGFLAEQREGSLSLATTAQARSALVFLLREVLGHEDAGAGLEVIHRPKEAAAVVWSESDVKRLLARLTPGHRAAVALLYGAGLRLKECLDLRIGDVWTDPATVFAPAGNGTWEAVEVFDPDCARIVANFLRLRQVQHEGEEIARVLAKAHGTAPERRRADDGALLDDLPLFVRGPGRTRAVNESGLQKAIRDAAGTGGFPDGARPETLRISAAVHRVLRGVDQAELARWLRFGDARSARRYLQLAERYGG
jgi:site-specific recombinase XerD